MIISLVMDLLKRSCPFPHKRFDRLTSHYG
jgi:hypothetical protein